MKEAVGVKSNIRILKTSQMWVLAPEYYQNRKNSPYGTNPKTTNFPIQFAMDAVVDFLILSW
jgi:hypothetical protein